MIAFLDVALMVELNSFLGRYLCPDNVMPSQYLGGVPIFCFGEEIVGQCHIPRALNDKNLGPAVQSQFQKVEHLCNTIFVVRPRSHLVGRVDSVHDVNGIIDDTQPLLLLRPIVPLVECESVS